MKTCLYALVALLPIGLANADTRFELRNSPLGLEPIVNSSNESLKTSADGQVYIAENERGAGQQLFARADDGEDDKGGKGKGKGKGKAKGHDKDKDKDADTEQEKSDPQPTSVQPPQPAAAKPAPGQPSAVAPAPTEAPATPNRAPTVSKRSPTELKAEMNQRLARITALDKNTATSNPRFTTISRETSVPVTTLQAQHKAYAVGSGGILIANEMAKATRKPANTFLKQRLQGRNWEQIAADNKFDLSPVLPKLERLQNTMEAVPQPAKR